MIRRTHTETSATFSASHIPSIGRNTHRGYFEPFCARIRAVLAHAWHVERRLQATTRFRCTCVSVWSDLHTYVCLTVSRSAAKRTGLWALVCWHAPSSTTGIRRLSTTHREVEKESSASILSRLIEDCGVLGSGLGVGMRYWSPLLNANTVSASLRQNEAVLLISTSRSERIIDILHGLMQSSRSSRWAFANKAGPAVGHITPLVTKSLRRHHYTALSRSHIARRPCFHYAVSCSRLPCHSTRWEQRWLTRQ